MELIQCIRQELLNPLPGKTYQYKLAPVDRPKFNADTSPALKAGVALILYKKKDKYHFILTKRSEYDGPHSGQVSFPGGKYEETDDSLLHTAMRETSEEIGIQLNQDDCLGQLSALEIAVSGFVVIPFVFYIDRDFSYELDKNEVDYIFHPSVQQLLDEDTLKNTRLSVGTFEIETPYYNLEKEIVWGATSMILAEFEEILLRIRKKNPGLI